MTEFLQKWRNALLVSFDQRLKTLISPEETPIKPVRVLWNPDNFKTSKTILIRTGTEVHFISTDNKSRDLIQTNFDWQRLSPEINLSTKLNFKQAGEFYFMSSDGEMKIHIIVVANAI